MIADDEPRSVLRALVDSLPDIVIRVDRLGRIRFINRIASGFQREEVIGTHWLAFVAADQRDHLAGLLQHTLTTGEVTEGEVLGQGNDGVPTWYSTRIAPVRDGDQITGAVLVARDIMEKKQAETQLILSDRMASLGTLAAGVAHELNNPLAAVIMNLELVAQDVAKLKGERSLPAELEEMLQDAREGAERLRGIVRDLRLFSREDGEERGAVQVESVLDSTLRLAAPQIRQRARLIKCYGGVPEVHGNQGRLGQVFLNLIVNAAQAIPEGRPNENEIRLTTERDAAGRILVSVADTGSGIPIDVQRRMFTPFFTTKPADIGTGLGLCICQRIVSVLGGEIWFESLEGRGTVFRVALLPVMPTSLTIPAAPRRARVLIVDDEPATTRAVKRLLARHHDVSAVHSVSAALATFAAGQRFDVVLCDVMMPQLTGIDLYLSLTRIDPDQARRVVFLTGSPVTPTTNSILTCLPNPILKKPLDAASLAATIQTLLD
jgi:PAS domain S-box-containing protein